MSLQSLMHVQTGRDGVLSKTMEGLQNCLKHKVMTGVCTSLCQSNFDLLSEKWLDRLIEMKVMYTWFHIYRPVGPDAKPELALTPDQQLQARKFVVEMRAKKPIIIIDANLLYEIDDRTQLESLIDEKIVWQVPAKTSADYFVIATAERLNGLVISNDLYQSYLDNIHGSMNAGSR